MLKKPFKLGLAPTRRNVFSREDSQKYKKLIEAKLEQWQVDFVNIDWLNDEGLLFSGQEAVAVAEKFKSEKVDALFVPHCNFGTEDAVAKLARSVGKPVLLWGPRDEQPLPDGTRLRDSQCGLFATSKILRRLNVPFTYIVSSRVDSKVFERGFKNFLGAANAANAFLGARIGQISTRPEGFWTVMVNEGELLEKWDIEIVPRSLVEIIQAAEKEISGHTKQLMALSNDLESKYNFGDIDKDIINKFAALKIAMSDFVDQAGLDAIAIQCWDALQDAFGIMPCLLDSILTAEGTPVACETDIHGALSSILLQNAARGVSPTFFADVTVRHPEDNNSELLWHCGPFPAELAAEGETPSVGCNYILESAKPGVLECRIKGGDITITRFDGDHGNYSLFIGEAESTDGPKNRGTYVWIKVNNWPEWEEKLIYGPYIHHVACIHAKVAPVLYEACKYMPGLQPDPVDPKLDEIRAYLRGDDINE